MSPEPPLAIDLFAGLGGWTDGLIAAGYRVVGFDNERHVYGDAKYPAQLVLQDVLTIHGRQFASADLIVASPPCQKYSYMAMPWSRAKQIAQEYRDGTRDVRQLTALFDACFRIQREAMAAAGRFIPLVVENVWGAQRWVGRARWHFGSFYLWGDVPALMPITRKSIKGHGGAWFKDAETADGTYGSGNFRIGVDGVKMPTMGAGWYPPDHQKHVRGLAFNGHADRNLRERERERICDCGHREGQHGFKPDEACSECSCINPVWVSHTIGRRTDVGNGVRFTSRDCGIENTIANAAPGHKQRGSGAAWWRGEIGMMPSKSSARKAASAHIAKIPFALAYHIGQAWYPQDLEQRP